jgi:hypothetical protein
MIAITTSNSIKVKARRVDRARHPGFIIDALLQRCFDKENEAKTREVRMVYGPIVTLV